jgi:geranylgeranyl reductase family protein
MIPTQKMTQPHQPDEVNSQVVVIGAGPAGTAAAIHLAQLGVRDVVLVDRHDFPRDKTCGSGVSPKGIDVLKALGVWASVTPHAYWIRGLRLVTPGDREVYVSGGDAAAAIICCRRILDHLLLERALYLGTRFIPHFEASRLLYEGNRAAGVVAREGRIIRAAYTIVANGAHSRLTMNQNPKRMMQAIMGWWEHVLFRPNHVEMIFDKMVAPCYGWLFPESETRVNIGICYEDENHTKNGRTLFREFLEKHYRTRLVGAFQAGDWKGHPISYSYRIAELQSPGRLIIGEAGRMTHPATAEGIYQGMRSGMIAAEAVRNVVQGFQNEQKSWAAYEAGCRHAFSTSFWSAKLWRRAVRSPLLDLLVTLGERPMVKSGLAKLMAQM